MKSHLLLYCFILIGLSCFTQVSIYSNYYFDTFTDQSNIYSEPKIWNSYFDHPGINQKDFVFNYNSIKNDTSKLNLLLNLNVNFKQFAITPGFYYKNFLFTIDIPFRALYFFQPRTFNIGDLYPKISYLYQFNNKALISSLGINIPTGGYKYFPQYQGTALMRYGNNSYDLILQSKFLINLNNYGYYLNLYGRIAGKSKYKCLLDYIDSDEFETYTYEIYNGSYVNFSLNAFIKPFKRFEIHFGTGWSFNSDGNYRVITDYSWDPSLMKIESGSNDNRFNTIEFRAAISWRIAKTDFLISLNSCLDKGRIDDYPFFFNIKINRLFYW